MAIWMFCRGDSAEQVPQSCSLHLNTSTMDIYRRWVETIAQEQKSENDNLVVGGPKLECEADE
eukprot:5835771-Alexandrium_andersonii.AAC.1